MNRAEGHPACSASRRETLTGTKSWTDREEKEAAKVLEHATRVEAFDLLMGERLTTWQISRRLRQRESRIGYHCRKLVTAGLVEVVEVEQVRGAKAKILRPTPLGLSARERIQSS